MMKVLFISNHAGFTKFNAPYMNWFHEQGWQVDNVSPGIETGYYDNQFDVDISRSPFSIKNFSALLRIKKIVKQQHYDLIHCHTPVGGVLGRLCVNINKCNTKVIYTAHGFHFFKGSNILNWILFYPIEKILSKKTSCIVTINEEDYVFAKKHFNKTIVEKISGVGVDLRKFKLLNEQEKKIIRYKNGLNETDFLLIYCAQFIKRKNHKYLITEIGKIRNKIPELKVCLVGNGKLEYQIKKIVKKKHLQNIVLFFGYRKDVSDLYSMSDILVSVSRQEGFGINLVEGLACGLPVVASNIRGHKDIMKCCPGNILFPITTNKLFNEILFLNQNKNNINELKKINPISAQQFSIESSLSQMSTIYKKVVTLI